MDKLLVVLLLFIMTVTAAAQPENKKEQEPVNPPAKLVIKGKVVDKETNEGMEYANIAIFNSRDSTLVTGGITDSEGVFKISDIQPGNFYVVANFIGFNKTRINNVQVSGNSRQVDLGVIRLVPATEKINTVEVIAERPRVEYKVDKKVINVSQNLNAAGGTAVDALENAPSVQVDLEGNVTLRGSSDFTVLINGRPTVLSGSDALQQLPASTIENIEIITNPSAKYEAEGTSGIINVILKKDVQRGITGIANVMAGTKDKYRADITMNHNTDKRKITVGANYDDRSFEGTNNETRETYTDNDTAFRIKEGDRGHKRGGYEFKGGIDFLLSEATTLGVSANYGHFSFKGGGNSNITEYSTSDPDNKTYFVEEDPGERSGDYVRTNMNFQHKFNDEGTHKLDAMLYYSHRTGDDTDLESTFFADENFKRTGEYSFRARSTEEDKDNDYRVQIDYTKPMGLTGKLEAGYQGRLERSWEDFIFQRWDENTDDWAERDPAFSGTMDFNHDIHAAYVTASGKLGFLQFMAGLRAEYAKREIKLVDVANPYTLELFDFFPTAHLSWELFSNNQIMASYSRRINRPRGRELTPFDQYFDQNTIRRGNPELKPEYTNSFEAGWLQRFGGGSFVTLEGFYRTTKDLISRTSKLGDDGILYLNTINVNDDQALGGELMGDVKITDWLKVNSSVSVYKYSVDDETTGKERKSTNVDGRLNATLKFAPHSRAEIIGEYRGPSVTSQGERKGMFYSNFSYRHDFFKSKLSAVLSLQDAFGTGKFEGTESGSNYKRTFKFQREPRVLMLTLSYKINNFLSSEKNNRSEDNGMDFDSGY